MNRKERNRLSQLKGAIKRARNSLHDTSLQVWACPKFVALVPGKGLASTFDATREIHTAVLDLNHAIEMLEAICALPIDAEDAPEVDPFADCGVPLLHCSKTPCPLP